MIIGQTLVKGVTAYSRWFPREGNAATLVLEVIGISGASLTVSILQGASGSRVGNQMSSVLQRPLSCRP